jgi:DNA polymerase (family 10)
VDILADGSLDNPDDLLKELIAHARQNGCLFEINSSPDRLDLSAENSRAAAMAGVMIAASTGAHSTREFGLVRYGLDQVRRAGLAKSAILNCLPWKRLAPLFKR